MTYQDKELSCKECGANFVFTVAEQEFFAEKGFQNEPSRCTDCRAARKARIGGNNNRQNSGFRQQREMFEAVCSACGVQTQVPFRPVESKPVYCRDCYQANKRY